MTDLLRAAYQEQAARDLLDLARRFAAPVLAGHQLDELGLRHRGEDLLHRQRLIERVRSGRRAVDGADPAGVAGFDRVDGQRRDEHDVLTPGKRPTTMKSDEEAVYDFATELLRRHGSPTPTYDRTLKRPLGQKKNLVDLTALVSTYATYAAFLNVNQTKLPPGSGPEYLPVQSGK